MGMFGDIISGAFGNGGTNQAEALAQAQQNMAPWQEAGQQAIGNMSNYTNQMGNNLSSYGNPAKQYWDRLSQSPQEMYQNFMEGYETSPQYQQRLQAMEKAMANASAASGMMGSGSFYNQWQNNANDILAADQDAWLANMMGIDDQQLKYLTDLRNTESNYLNSLNNISAMGQNAATTSGNWASQQGALEDANNPWGNIANLGIAGGMYALGGPAGLFASQGMMNRK